jgi:hypothetical protein
MIINISDTRIWYVISPDIIWVIDVVSSITSQALRKHDKYIQKTVILCTNQVEKVLTLSVTHKTNDCDGCIACRGDKVVEGGINEQKDIQYMLHEQTKRDTQEML